MKEGKFQYLFASRNITSTPSYAEETLILIALDDHYYKNEV